MEEQQAPRAAVGAVVLCGGRSTRMGMSKADLPFGDESLLRRVIGRIRSAGLDTILLAAAEGQALPKDAAAEAHVVRDERPEHGPLEALRVALRAAEPDAEAVFVTACDTPHLEPKLIRHLVDQLGDHDIVATSEEHFVHPLIAVYRTRLAGRIDQLIANQQMRPLTLIEQSRSLVIDVEQLREFDPELLSFRTMNRPADYYAALEREGFTAPEDVRRMLEG